jgi:hypothetical protein
LATLEVHPRVAMQILRHSKIAVTMEIYTEVPSAATGLPGRGLLLGHRAAEPFDQCHDRRYPRSSLDAGPLPPRDPG